MTLAEFRTQYPEFALADDTVIQAQLDYATAITPSTVWLALQDQGIGLRAARALALSPFARNMALVSKDGATVYDDRLNDLIQIVALGGLVI